MKRASLAAAAVLAAAASSLAVPEGWHRSLEDGLRAARRSGKPVLVVTAWPEKI